MKRFIILISLSILLITAKAQMKNARYKKNLLVDKINLFPDSIRVDFPNEKVFVVFELSQYIADHSCIDSFNSVLSELMINIRKSSTDIDFATTSHCANVVIRSEDEKQISIQSTDHKSTKLIIKKNQLTELLPAGWEINITNSSYKIFIYGKDLTSIEAIVDTNFKLIPEKINSQLPQTMGRKSISAYLVLKDGLIERDRIEFKRPVDIYLSDPTIGFGFVADSFYPTASLVTINMIFRDRYGRKNFRLRYDNDYMLLTRKRLDGKTTLNSTFGLSISCSWNVGKNFGNTRWAGIGLGVLNNRSDPTCFSGNTLRLSASFDVGHNFTLVPEYYLTDNVTNALAGLKLNYKIL